MPYRIPIILELGIQGRMQWLGHFPFLHILFSHFALSSLIVQYSYGAWEIPYTESMSLVLSTMICSGSLEDIPSPSEGCHWLNSGTSPCKTNVLLPWAMALSRLPFTISGNLVVPVLEYWQKKKYCVNFTFVMLFKAQNWRSNKNHTLGREIFTAWSSCSNLKQQNEDQPGWREENEACV